jgi:arsenite methyltransferase
MTMPQDTQTIRAMVRDRFARIANSPGQERKFPIGPESAKRLGYDPVEIDQLPAWLTESFCGVGNPLGLGQIRPGETVLDLGCGAGVDSVLAAKRVGPSGKVIGVDTTEEMLEKARRAATALGRDNIRFVRGDLQDLPLENEQVDVAISNGVINLTVDKPKVLAEIYRVLKPDGRLLLADILLEDNVSAEEVARLGTWSD